MKVFVHKSYGDIRVYRYETEEDVRKVAKIMDRICYDLEGQAMMLPEEIETFTAREISFYIIDFVRDTEGSHESIEYGTGIYDVE